ncbi:hypothetical protein FHW96_004881 [Novosphingobium sp. SG751A]|uniref:hypothetical protein n=1 Tax=Novosphingobium sp. SG751A TaxID=2587000 RepID=UPI001555F1D8|nr:hypothetical protein [Novosphingobium sp. SG751A]NOW48691.1 hypothetical protein [Novosphingobium sp. SG751A]
MTTRRTLIKGAITAVLGSAATSANSLTPESGLEALMVRQLTRELGSESVARKLGPLVFEASMFWSYPKMPATDADALIAFSFGNRIPAPGTDDKVSGPDGSVPGPVNAMLAKAVAQIRAIKDMPV